MEKKRKPIQIGQASYLSDAISDDVIIQRYSDESLARLGTFARRRRLKYIGEPRIIVHQPGAFPDPLDTVTTVGAKVMTVPMFPAFVTYGLIVFWKLVGRLNWRLANA